MLNSALGMVLLAHGIGHSMGILQVVKVATVNRAWRDVGLLAAVLALHWAPAP